MMHLGLLYGTHTFLEGIARHGRTGASHSQLPLLMELQSAETSIFHEPYCEMIELKAQPRMRTQ